jgi:hypothetical protein
MEMSKADKKAEAESHFTAPTRNRGPFDQEAEFRRKRGLLPWTRHEADRLAALEKKTATLKALREEREAAAKKEEAQ